MQIPSLRDRSSNVHSKKGRLLLTSDVIAISCGTCTSTVNVGCQLVKLLAVLVSHDRSSCGSGIGSKGNTSLK